MQVTTSVTKQESDWATTLGIGAGIVVCLLLFSLVIARMGLFNGKETAVSLPSNTLLFTAKEMRFSQLELHVRAGEEVTLQLQNEDLYGHSFDIEALNLHVQMPANDRVTAVIAAPEPGIHQIYCGVPGHREAGMIATLVVDP